MEKAKHFAFPCHTAIYSVGCRRYIPRACTACNSFGTGDILCLKDPPCAAVACLRLV